MACSPSAYSHHISLPCSLHLPAPLLPLDAPYRLSELFLSTLRPHSRVLPSAPSAFRFPHTAAPRNSLYVPGDANPSLLTPLHAQHPTHVIAVTSILLATRLRQIPLPEGWYLLFDVVWDDIAPCCGVIMALWRDWGCSPLGKSSGLDGLGGAEGDDAEETEQRRQDRWRRAWVLAESRKAVRKWVEEAGSRS